MKKISSKFVINCAGETVEQIHTGIAPSYQDRPRKGQYLVLPKIIQNLKGPKSIVFAAPTERKKGVQVYRSLYNNLVIGPYTDEFEEGTEPTVDPAITEDLYRQATEMLPALKETPVDRSQWFSYVGWRPQTQYRDYYIRVNQRKNWITVLGIRQTGLTAAMGIAKHVTNLMKKAWKPKILRSSPNYSLTKSKKQYDVEATETVARVKQGMDKLTKEIQKAAPEDRRKMPLELHVDNQVFKIHHPILKVGLTH